MVYGSSSSELVSSCAFVHHAMWDDPIQFVIFLFFFKRIEFSSVSLVLARRCFDKVCGMCSIGSKRGIKND